MNELNKSYQLFLEILQSSLTEDFSLYSSFDSENELENIIDIAKVHSVLPMVIESIFNGHIINDSYLGNEMKQSGSFLPGHTSINSDQIMQQAITQARYIVINQAKKTADFIHFYHFLEDNDLHPIVMKGIICRNCYLQSEHRPSLDEDLLVDPSEFQKYHKVITSYGLLLNDSSLDIEKADEISYYDPKGNLRIELHKYPFPPSSLAYGNLNRFFAGVQRRYSFENIYNTKFHTFTRSDQLLYIILHSFKHFLHSGIGIRPVCDIIMFSKKYREQIQWHTIKTQLIECNVFDFTRALYRIGDKYLCPNYTLQKYLAEWDIGDIDEMPLLLDILEGGLYGSSTKNRIHSSNLTLHAYESSKKKLLHSQAQKTISIIHTVFLPYDSMAGRYTYLKKYPFMLPVAWIQRIFKYFSEMRSIQSESNAFEAVHVGEERIELLRKYNIIR